MTTINTDEVIEAHPSAAPSFDFESFHRNMNQLKVQTAQVRRGVGRIDGSYDPW